MMCELIYLLLCHVSHHLMLTFQVLTHDMVNLKEMIDLVIHHLKVFLQSSDSQLRLLHK
jgi:hypothetical protein